MKKTLNPAACIVAVALICVVRAADAPPPANPPASNNASEKNVSEEERDLKKEKKVRLNGRLEMEPTDDSGEKKQTIFFDGYLYTKSGPVPIKAEDDDILLEMRTRTGETVTLEGRGKESDMQGKWLLVKRIVDQPQPPSDVRNPRGL